MTTPACLTRRANFSVSSLIGRAICSGVLPTGSAPMSSMRFLNSGDSRACTSLGVRAGASTPNQVPMVTAKARSLPALMCGSRA